MTVREIQGHLTELYGIDVSPDPISPMPVAGERRPVDFLEQLPPRDAEPVDRPRLVESGQQIADRCIDLGQAIEGR